MFKRLGFLPVFMIVVLAMILGIRAAAADPDCIRPEPARMTTAH